MSLSNPTLTNPSQHFFQWGGSTGKLTWYDKENKRNVEVRLPFEFIVLDQLATIVGYNKKMEVGYYSNEVRNTRKNKLYVKTKNGIFEEGLYENLTKTLKSGGKYAKSIYIAHKVDDELIIGNIKASGSALSAWIEFTNSIKQNGLAASRVKMTVGNLEESPVGDFYPPKFELIDFEEGDFEIAVELDRELQIYLNQYLNRPEEGEEEVTEEEIEDIGRATPEQIREEEQRKQEKKEEPKYRSGYQKAKEERDRLKNKDLEDEQAIDDYQREVSKEELNETFKD